MARKELLQNPIEALSGLCLSTPVGVLLLQRGRHQLKLDLPGRDGLQPRPAKLWLLSDRSGMQSAHTDAAENAANSRWSGLIRGNPGPVSTTGHSHGPHHSHTTARPTDRVSPVRWLWPVKPPPAATTNCSAQTPRSLALPPSFRVRQHQTTVARRGKPV